MIRISNIFPDKNIFAGRKISGLVMTCFCITWLLIPRMIFAQTRANVTHFSKADYKAGSQNWDIAEDSSGNLFVANNEGLLVLNVTGTRLYPLPAKTSIRSVAISGNRIYTGSFEEIGFWTSTPTGEFVYESLIPLCDDVSFNNDEFWKIVAHNNRIYFQSFGNILVYDGQSVERLELPGSVLFLLESAGTLFVQQINGALFTLSGSTFTEIPGSSIFRDTEVKAIVPFGGDQHLIGTGTKGIFLFNGTGFSPWQNDANELLKSNKLNNGIRLDAQTVAFGTILKGLFLLDNSGRLITNLHTDNALQNNTVLSIKRDKAGNIWAALDKGFDFVWLNGSVDAYRTRDESIGAVYSAALFKNELFVGTNQGIYYYQIGADGQYVDRRFVQNSQGQCWFLKVVDGHLYAGLNDGTFVMENHQLKRVSDATGGFNFMKFEHNEQEFAIQSTYSPVVVYKKTDEIWRQSHNLSGFSAPIRFLEVDHLGNFLMGHAVKGLFVAQTSAGFDSLLSVRKLGVLDGLNEGTSRFAKVDYRILFPGGDGLYQWDATAGKITVYEEINSQLEGFESARTIIPISQNRYWFIKNSEIGMFEIRFGKAKLLYRLIPKMYQFQMVENYENIVALNDSLHVICLEDGFALLNLYKLNQLPERNRPPVLSEVRFLNGTNQLRSYVAPAGQTLTSSIDFNTFSASFSTDESIGTKKFYSFKLSGIDEKWSDWNETSTVSYSRLPTGSYTFQVKTLTAKGILTEPAHVSFRILEPWFLSVYAFFLEGFIAVALFALVRMGLKRRKWRLEEQKLLEENQKMKLEKEHAEAELLKVNNDRLHFEISSKNMQLAKNTMLMLRKNESLIEIKTELEKLKEDLGYRLPAKRLETIVKLIDQSLDSEHDWEVFELLFDQAHDNFFKRLKLDYPDLTSSDLRLCAYLRMNLTSKEIAPLLNITTRGVEEKRYRLRKRLNLSSEKSLTEFILGF